MIREFAKDHQRATTCQTIAARFLVALAPVRLQRCRGRGGGVV